MPKSNTFRSKPSLSNLLPHDQKDQKIIELMRKNASLCEQLHDRQNYMDQMYEDIMKLTELLELEQQRVKQLQEEVIQLKENK